ncbi:MAG: hypothetical protein GY713_09570 [Actinomycetia bacterium]|nr:hypothetical protein [Actinomycetes bacterium]
MRARTMASDGLTLITGPNLVPLRRSQVAALQALVIPAHQGRVGDTRGRG